MTISIIYHDADFNGKLSNEVCKHWLRKLHPGATIHSYGWDYGRPVPEPVPYNENYPDERARDWEDYDTIYIVDLSVDELMSNPDLRNKIIWIDHHKSAIEKWDKPTFGRPENDGGPTYALTPFAGYRIDGVAACRLCWQWFLGAETAKSDEGWFALPLKENFIDRLVSEPELIRLAGEYDIWDHRDPYAKALQFGLRVLCDEGFKRLIADEFNGVKDSEDLDTSKRLEECILDGISIKSYCDKQNDEYSATFSQTFHWEGLTFCALNTGQRGNSDLLRGGIKPEHDACFSWRWTGKEVLVSLYHVEGKTHHDLSVIAVKYGGGGHRGACGFRLTLEELSKIITP